MSPSVKWHVLLASVHQRERGSLRLRECSQAVGAVASGRVGWLLLDPRRALPIAGRWNLRARRIPGSRPAAGVRPSVCCPCRNAPRGACSPSRRRPTGQDALPHTTPPMRADFMLRSGGCFLLWGLPPCIPTALTRGQALQGLPCCPAPTSLSVTSGTKSKFLGSCQTRAECHEGPHLLCSGPETPGTQLGGCRALGWRPGLSPRGPHPPPEPLLGHSVCADL